MVVTGNSGWGGHRRALSVDGEDELSSHVPGVADLLGRGGLVERVGGDGGAELAGRGVLRYGGQAVGRFRGGSPGKGDAEPLRMDVGDGDDALGAAPQSDGVLQGPL